MTSTMLFFDEKGNDVTAIGKDMLRQMRENGGGRSDHVVVYTVTVHKVNVMTRQAANMALAGGAS